MSTVTFEVHYKVPNRENYKDERGNLVPFSSGVARYDNISKVRDFIRTANKDVIVEKVESVVTTRKIINVYR